MNVVKTDYKKHDSMRENDMKVKATYKSEDTEEWLDKVWTRPIGYWWARVFARLGVHPNVVTVLSMIIGAGSALFFIHGSFWYEGWFGFWMNVTAVLMLSIANFFDSADGQLARMTGKKTRLGRILDGAASEVWFIPIYLCLAWRFYCYHSIEFDFLGIEDTAVNAAWAAGIFLVVVIYSGFGCHGRQCGLSDYYRQIHLYFLNGARGSEFDNSESQLEEWDETPWKDNVVWKLFLGSYIQYTKSQEDRTPCFQRLMRRLRERYAAPEDIPQEFRDRFRAQSLPLMMWTNVLTFNTRAVVLYATCLLDVPCVYFLFEVIVMSLICSWMHARHERMCRRLARNL